MQDVDRAIVATKFDQPPTLAAIRRYVADVKKELPRYEPIRNEIRDLRATAKASEDPDVRRQAISSRG